MIGEIKEIYEEIESVPKLAHIVVNKKCNLLCQHCDWPEKFTVDERHEFGSVEEILEYLDKNNLVKRNDIIKEDARK